MSIGKPLPHDAAPLHVTGEARYTDDIPLPAGALHLAFGQSSCAHGEITAIDLAAVRAAELDLGFTPSPSLLPSMAATELPVAAKVKGSVMGTCSRRLGRIRPCCPCSSMFRKICMDG